MNPPIGVPAYDARVLNTNRQSKPAAAKIDDAPAVFGSEGRHEIFVHARWFGPALPIELAVEVDCGKAFRRNNRRRVEQRPQPDVWQVQIGCVDSVVSPPLAPLHILRRRESHAGDTVGRTF